MSKAIKTVKVAKIKLVKYMIKNVEENIAGFEKDFKEISPTNLKKKYKHLEEAKKEDVDTFMKHHEESALLELVLAEGQLLKLKAQLTFYLEGK